VEEYIRNYLQEKLVKLTSELEAQKQGIKFKCKCSVIPFETAIDMNFLCPECGEKLSEHDNSTAINKLVSDISLVEGLLVKT
jgi:transcription initiation factor IIE alpha subunit